MKKLIALILAMAMVMALAACAPSKGGASNETTGTTAATDAAPTIETVPRAS
jgi:hypothetical protein